MVRPLPHRPFIAITLLVAGAAAGGSAGKPVEGRIEIHRVDGVRSSGVARGDDRTSSLPVDRISRSKTPRSESNPELAGHETKNLEMSLPIKVKRGSSQDYEGDIFGRSVAVSCNWMAVAAPGADEPNTDSGTVLFRRRNYPGADSWGPWSKFDPSWLGVGDALGMSLDLDHDVLVAGAPYNDDEAFNAGAVYIIENLSLWDDSWPFSPATKITASDAEESDTFGRAVAVGGGIVVVGASGDDDLGTAAGSAYIFEKVGGSWVEVTKLTASDGGWVDRFGWSAAVSGDTVVIGAFGHSPGTTDFYQPGAAYIFERNHGGANAWGEVAKLEASDSFDYDGFGYSVDIDGDFIVVGSWRQDDLGEDAGAAYIFRRNAGGADAWGEVTKLTAPDGAAGDHFGETVSVSGDVVVVGASQHDGDTGTAYVFERNIGGSDGWGVTSQLTAPDAAAEAVFGISVSIDGNIIAVGASGDDEYNENSGAAYVFERKGRAWVSVARCNASDAASGDNLGTSIDIDGDTMVVGAPLESDAGTYSGAAYIFQRNQGWTDGWRQVAKIVAADAAAYDSFGSDVAIHLGTVVVGAAKKGISDIGAAYVFERNQGGADAWGQVVKLTPSDGESYDRFGSEVAIDNDLIVVGAPTGSTNPDPGAAYVFRRHSGGADNWGEVAILVPSDGTSYDYFGSDVGVDGDTVVVGADLAGTSGSIYVFDRTEGGADNWGELLKIPSPTPDGGIDLFGNTLSIACDTIVVGAVYESHVLPNAGAAYVFGRNEGGRNAWGLEATLTAADPAEGDRFGVSVDLQCDSVAVGASQENVIGAAGFAHTFRRNLGGADAWGREAMIVASDYAVGSRFGQSVGIAENHIVVGAPLQNGQRGRAYVFQYDAPIGIGIFSDGFESGDTESWSWVVNGS